jgi:hypothetical protein
MTHTIEKRDTNFIIPERGSNRVSIANISDGGFLKLIDGSSFLLLIDGVSKLQLVDISTPIGSVLMTMETRDTNMIMRKRNG